MIENKATELTNFKSAFPEYAPYPSVKILAAIKERYPEYGNYDDLDLASALEAKFSGGIPEDFAPAGQPSAPTTLSDIGRAVADVPVGLGKGIARFALSLPAAAGGLVRELGETAEDEPNLVDKILLSVVPMGDALYWGKRLRSAAAKKTDLDEKLAKKGKEIVDKNRQWVNSVLPRGDTKVERFFEDLGSGAGSLAAAVGTAVLTKSPSAAAVVFGTIQKGQMYTEAREAGRTPGEASVISTAAGVAEAVLEKVGLDFMLKKFGSKIATHLIHMGSESIQEISQSLSEATIARIGGIRNDEWETIAKDAIYEGVIGGLLGGGASLVMHRKAELVERGLSEEEADKVLRHFQKRAEELVTDIQGDIDPEEIGDWMKDKIAESSREEYVKWWMDAIPQKTSYEMEGERTGKPSIEGVHAMRSGPQGRSEVLRSLQEMEEEGLKKSTPEFGRKELAKAKGVLRSIGDISQQTQKRKGQEELEKAGLLSRLVEKSAAERKGALARLDKGQGKEKYPDDWQDIVDRHKLRYDGIQEDPIQGEFYYQFTEFEKTGGASFNIPEGSSREQMEERVKGKIDEFERGRARREAAEKERQESEESKKGPDDSNLSDEVKDFMIEHRLAYKGTAEDGHVFEPTKTAGSPLTVPEDQLNAEGLRVALMRHYRDEGLTKEERALYKKRSRKYRGELTEEEYLKRLGQRLKRTKEQRDRRDEADRYEEYEPVEMTGGELAEAGKGARFNIEGEEYEVKKVEPGDIVIEDGERYEIDEFDKIPVDHGKVKPGKKPKIETVKVPGAKHEQVVSPELLGQAKMPAGKIRKNEGRTEKYDYGLFGREEGEQQRMTLEGDVSSIESLKSKIEKFYDETIASKDNVKRDLSLGRVSDAEADRIQEATNIDVHGYERKIDNYSIRHILKEHGSVKEESKRGQIPVTREDIGLIPYIIDNYDSVSASSHSKRAGLNILLFTKKVNGITYYLEEVRIGRKELIPLTMYKKISAATPRATSSEDEGVAHTSETFRSEPKKRDRNDKNIEKDSGDVNRKIDSPPSGVSNLFDRSIKKPSELAGVEGEEGAKGMSSQDLVNHVKEIFPEITFRGKALDRWRQGVAGRYFQKHNFVKTRNETDVSAMCHEVAHWFQEQVFGEVRSDEPGFSGDKIREELENLDYDQGDGGRRIAEGFAEFVRYWATGENVHEVAPEFTSYFETKFLPEHDLQGRFERLKSSISQFRRQGAKEFASHMIGFERARNRLSKAKEWAKKYGDLPKDEKVETLASWWSRVKGKVMDDAAPAEYILKRFLGKNYFRLKAKENPVELYRTYKMKAGAMAEEMLYNGVYDIRTSESINDIRGPAQVLRDVKKAGHQIDDFIIYLYAKHAKTWLQHPDYDALLEKTVEGSTNERREALEELSKFKAKNPGLTLDQCNHLMGELGSSEFDAWGQEITDYFDGLMQLVAREGGVDGGLVEHLRERYPYYVPLFREMFDEVAPARGVTRRGLANQSSPISRAKGSDRPFQYYMDAWIKQTERMILWAQKARVMNSITNLAAIKGMAPLVKQTSPPSEIKQITAEQVKQILGALGIDFEGDVEVPEDQAFNLFFNETYYRGRHPVIAVWKNGRRRWFELHPMLFDFVQQVESQPIVGLAKWLAPFSRGVRLGATGINPTFVFYRNFIRDSLTATVMSESGTRIPVVPGFRALLSEIARGKDEGSAFRKALESVGYDTKYADYYLKSGGVVSTMAGFDRTKLEKMAALLESKVEGKTLTFGLRHPVEGLRLVFAAMENANRIPEFKTVYDKVLKQTGDKEEAFIRAARASQDVTTDFARSGTWGRQLNQIIPFYNANLQGANKFFRGFTEKEITGYRKGESGFTDPVWSRKNAPKRMAKALAWITGLSMLTYWLRREKEYEKLKDWERYSYFHFWVGDHHIRIVTPFLVGAIFHGAVQSRLAKKEGDPRASKEYVKWLWDNHLSELFPMPDRVAFFGPLLQVGSNKSWSGRPIEPKFAREWTPPHLIFSEHTTELMKGVMSLKPLRYTGISPVQAEYFVNQISGGLYKRSMEVIQAGVKLMMGENVSLKPVGMYDVPIIGNMFARPSIMNNKWTERFYYYWKEYKQLKNTEVPFEWSNLVKNAYSKIGRIRKSKLWSEELKDRKVVEVMEQTVKHIEEGKPDAAATGRSTKKRTSVGF